MLAKNRVWVFVVVAVVALAGTVAGVKLPAALAADTASCPPGGFMLNPVKAINVGGPQVTVGGKTWQADKYGSGGHVWRNPTTVDIANTSLDELYRTERAAPQFTYNIPVQAGRYLVRLHLAEIYWNAPGGSTSQPGKRVETLTVEGQGRLADYNPVSDVGGVMKAVVRGFEARVSDGALTITGSAKVDMANLMAIEASSITPCPAPGSPGSTSSNPQPTSTTTTTTTSPSTTPTTTTSSSATTTGTPIDAPVVAPTTTSTTTSEVAAPCTGIVITSSSNVQEAINAAPQGSTFCFTAGTYRVSKLIPKPGDVFDGKNRQAILDGGNSSEYAFFGDASSVGPANVTIRGFVIKNFKTPLQAGAIQAFNAPGWTIRNNEISHNAATAVATGDDVKVINNLLNFNGQQGYAVHGNRGLYEGNEIAFNNADLAVDPTWEAGAGKAWGTKNLTFRKNYVHDNGGPGLWTDTNNIYTTYDGNRVENNWGPGIYHEISYNATIINNTVKNNGMPSSPGGGDKRGWLFSAGIQLRQSQSLDAATPLLIANNIVVNNYNGISLIDGPAYGCTNAQLNEGAYGPCKIQNVLVKDNYVTMSQGTTGLAQDGVGNAVFSSQNNRFVGNRYCVATSAHPKDGYADDWFAWNNANVGWARWQAAGHDAQGSFTVGTICGP